ncbi:hypothetical protein N7495_005181 [Penicillium taxi]|uniref:uncharacterized protein n=1 Tax=Penicillium taxi TaxID=168475 RepID=UPI0025450118|nr:uncharacterized protein N7495_005181 [Penicillium taxi]KAJ5893490.1 hypothetical protein N7495_005181 [Penicillium taxi]
MGQAKWLHLKSGPRRLTDFGTFDDASRGVWLLLTIVKWNLATMDALITILRLSFVPFAQQVVLIEQRDIIYASDTATFGYAHNYSQDIPHASLLVNVAVSKHPFPTPYTTKTRSTTNTLLTRGSTTLSSAFVVTTLTAAFTFPADPFASTRSMRPLPVQVTAVHSHSPPIKTVLIGLCVSATLPPAMATSATLSTLFEQFALKVEAILKSDSAQEVLQSMRALAESRELHLISDGTYFGDYRVVPIIGPANSYIRRLQPPLIIAPSGIEPVKPLLDDLSFVRKYLLSSSTAKAVVASRNQFGWQKLNTDCICLHVDDDEETSINASLPTTGDPILTMKVNLSRVGDHVSKAKQLLEPVDLTGPEVSDRDYKFRCVLRTVMRPPLDSQLRHGQSISLADQEAKGSIGVFVTDCSDGGRYALTAYHVLPFKEADNALVKTPGLLDGLALLYDAVREKGPDRVKELLRVEGWDSDYTLLKLDDSVSGVNGSWYSSARLLDCVAEAERPHPEFFGVNGVIGCAYLKGGEVCYKDGAATGISSGKIGNFEYIEYLKGTRDSAPVGTSREDVNVSRFIGFHGVCDRGDSGCGVFKPMREKDGWEWTGQLVAMAHSAEDPPKPSIGLMIPSTKVLKALEKTVGGTWKLSEPGSCLNLEAV